MFRSTHRRIYCTHVSLGSVSQRTMTLEGNRVRPTFGECQYKSVARRAVEGSSFVCLVLKFHRRPSSSSAHGIGGSRREVGRERKRERET